MSKILETIACVCFGVFIAWVLICMAFLMGVTIKMMIEDLIEYIEQRRREK